MTSSWDVYGYNSLTSWRIYSRDNGRWSPKIVMGPTFCHRWQQCWHHYKLHVSVKCIKCQWSSLVQITAFYVLGRRVIRIDTLNSLSSCTEYFHWTRSFCWSAILYAVWNSRRIKWLFLLACSLFRIFYSSITWFVLPWLKLVCPPWDIR